MALIHKIDSSRSGNSSSVPPDLKVHESIADILRMARQDHGQDLRTVAQVLRIRYDYLEAIEKGDFDQLPGAAYATGFLRTYAEFLGLDGQEIIEQYKREIQGVGPKPDLVFPQPVGHTRIPGGALVLISAVLLGLAYGGWFYLSNEGRNIADLMPPMPERLLAMFSGDDDGQGAVTPEFVTPESVTAESQTAPETPSLGSDSSPGADSLAYSPPERAEAESQAPTASSETVNAADIEPLAPAPTELAALDGPMPPTNLEVAQDDAVAPEILAPILAPAPETAEAPDDLVPDNSVPETAVSEAAVSEAAVSEAAVSEAAVETVEAVELPEPVAPVEPEPSAAPANSLLALAAVAAPASPSTAASAGSVEPMLDETALIPAPPTATRDLVLSSERLPRVYGESNQDARIILRAVQDSWVQVRDRQDALLLTRVLRHGDSYYVPSQDGLTLLTGNAGGIVIEVDGVAMAPLGPVGAVRRQIALDPTRLLDGTALPR